MLRRRPIARAAVTTSVVVGTATRTTNRVEQPPRPARPLTPARSRNPSDQRR